MKSKYEFWLALLAKQKMRDPLLDLFSSWFQNWNAGFFTYSKCLIKNLYFLFILLEGLKSYERMREHTVSFLNRISAGFFFSN